MSGVVRIQRQRAKGWRMPEGAVYVGRPTPWGNPYPATGEQAMWFALAVGEYANPAGRRRAAVKAYRWWLTDNDPRNLIPARRPGPGDIEYASGRTQHIADIPVGMGLMMLAKDGPFPLSPGDPPDLSPLRDATALACWCPLDMPCHADVLIELLTRPATPAPSREVDGG